MKTIFNIITTLILFLFSMIYTKKAITFLQDRDPLMKEIKDQENNYYQKPVNAIITNNYIIPGISGIKVNINKSYKKMKIINTFNSSLLVYDIIYPEISLQNHYNKVIIKGNLLNKQISLILNIKNIQNLSTIDNILKENNIYVDIYSNNEINIHNTNFKNIVTDKFFPFTNYCLYNNKIIENCINNKIYTINAIQVKSLQEIKNTISNGIIYLYNVNNEQDLNIIIKYLKNNNYEIKTIDNLIKE